MVDARKNLHRQVMKSLPKRFPEVLASRIPYLVQAEWMADGTRAHQQLRAPVPSRRRVRGALGGSRGTLRGEGGGRREWSRTTDHYHVKVVLYR